MAPQWSPDEDRALLLALVQVMAPNGPSKHQFTGALEILNDRWTLSAITQHYNKKLRLLAPSNLGAGSNPATPVRTATKRKAPVSKAASASASPAPAAKGRGKKKAATKAASEEVASEGGDDDEGRDEDEDGEKPVAKKAKKADAPETEDEESSAAIDY